MLQCFLTTFLNILGPVDNQVMMLEYLTYWLIGELAQEAAFLTFFIQDGPIR